MNDIDKIIRSTYGSSNRTARLCLLAEEVTRKNVTLTPRQFDVMLQAVNEQIALTSKALLEKRKFDKKHRQKLLALRVALFRIQGKR